MDTDTYLAELAPTEALYHKIKNTLDQKERDHVEALRARKVAGEAVYYGHDLHAAVGRGLNRQAVEKAHAVLAKIEEARPAASEAVIFAGALTALVEASAQRGCSAVKLRQFLLSCANAEDSTRLEKLVEANRPPAE